MFLMAKAFVAKGIFKILKAPKTQWVLKRKFPNFFFIPHMYLKELFLFKTLCKNKNVFIEFGSGGSTIFLLNKGKRVFSVESDPEFYQYMNEISLVQKLNGTSLHLSLIDLGKHNGWGIPLSLEKKEDWYKYYTQIWERINPQKTKVDAIYIDGRLRVCCTLYSILKLVEYGWTDTLLIIHDFWNRKQYHIVKKFLKECKSVARLGSFLVKDNVNTDEVKGLINQYAFMAE